MASSFRIRMDRNTTTIGMLIKKLCDNIFLNVMKHRINELTPKQKKEMLGGNRAVVFCEVDDETLELHSHSSVSESNHPFHDVYVTKIHPKKTRVLKHVDEDGLKNINISGWNRDSDCEAKLLQQIAKKYTFNSKGYIYMYTRFSPCLSCDYHIVQFVEKFPEIELHVYYDYDYPHNLESRFLKK
jgi:hypothetical protein